MQIPPLPTRRKVTLADLADQVTALHGCVHETQKDTRAGFDKIEQRVDDGFSEVHDRITDVAQRVSYVEGAASVIGRTVGAALPPRPSRDGEEQVVETTKHKSLLGSMSRASAGVLAAAGAFGGFTLYKVIVMAAPAAWQFLISLHHAVLSAAG